MSLVPRDSWADFSRFIDNSFPALRTRFEEGSFSPRVDIVEKDQAFEVTADLPGVKKKISNLAASKVCYPSKPVSKLKRDRKRR